MKKSVSGFLNHVAEVFTPPPDDADQEAIVIRNQQPVILNRLQVRMWLPEIRLNILNIINGTITVISN